MASETNEAEAAPSEAKENIVNEDLHQHISSETFTKENSEEPDVDSTSSYTLACQSQFSCDVDRWIRGSSMESTGVQNSRVQLVQRSTLATTASLGMTGMWYFLAMVLPLFSVTDGHTRWRCTPSTVLNTAGLIFTHISIVCENIKSQIRRLARDQVAREVIATAMDVVLAVYAVGFLIISMYQASIIG